MDANSALRLERATRPRLTPARALHHLQVLQGLIHRDYLTGSDLSFALHDLAERVQSAVMASETLVTLFHANPEQWLTISATGQQLSYAAITRQASRTVLEQVRSSGEAVIATAEEGLALASESILDLRLESLLAVPLFFWDGQVPEGGRFVGGCLYAHRTAELDPFTREDVSLVHDITAIAQSSLNLLRHLQTLRQTLEETEERLRAVAATASREYRLGDFETRDPQFADKVIGLLQRVSRADRVALMILGPSGSGKSYLAQAYHYACPRRKGPFVVLDCAQVTSAETLSAELFGYASRSGYANAPQEGRPGKAQLADRGTLFIDEVGCLPAELQQRLLRLIQTGRFSPLGGSEERQVDLQIITATNEDLAALVQKRLFREDLYWRLAEIVVHLPPLSHRPADIPPLATRLLERACQRYGMGDVKGFSPAALECLVRYDWARAGNLRGLEHTIHRTVLLAPAGLSWLDVAQLQLQSPFDYRTGAATPEGTPAADSGAGRTRGGMGGREGTRGASATVGGPGSTEEEKLSEADIQALKDAIVQCGTGTRAAKMLGISRHTLVGRLRKAGLTIRELLGEGE